MSFRIPDFDYRLTDRDGERVVLIVDLDQGAMSVTNAPEKVLELIEGDLMGQGLAGSRVYYRDSEGQWDELALDTAGKFATFEPCKPDLREELARTWGRT